MFFLTFFAIICIYVCTKWTMYRMEINRKLAPLPGPKGYPLIGIVLELLDPTVLLDKFLGYSYEFGGIFKAHLGFAATYIGINDCELAEAIMTSSKFIEKSNDYNFLKSWLGNGLITAPGNIWAKHRKLLTPTFHFQVLVKMIENLGGPVDILVNKLHEKLDSGCKDVDIYPFIALCSLDMICESTMGISVNAQEDSQSKFVQETKRNLHIISTRIFSPLKQTEFMFNMSFDHQRQKQTNKYLHKVTDDVILKKRVELENCKEGKEVVEEDEFGVKKKKALLDLLLEAEVLGQKMSDAEIRQEVDTIMFAGHDTTASATSFTLYEISRHPEVQARIYEEIQSIFGDDKTRHATLADLNQMSYLEMAIKEALRLYPPVPVIGRQVFKDTYYKDILFPKGVTIALLVYCLQRNPKYFPEPENFIPERFTPEEQSKRPPFTYIPFSAGQRNCIGQKLAMFSMKSMISQILRNFELLPVAERKLQLTTQIILKSNNGIYLRLKKRK